MNYLRVIQNAQTMRRKKCCFSMLVFCFGSICMIQGSRAEENEEICDPAMPCTFQIEDKQLQPVPTFFKFQARISKAKMPVDDALFESVFVNLVKGSDNVLCREEIPNVRVVKSVLNLEIGRRMTCDFEEIIAQNSDLSFQICIKNQENCLKPIQLSTVPYSVKSSFAQLAQKAHQSNVSGQAHYAHRLTADKEMLVNNKIGTGYFDFQTENGSDADFAAWYATLYYEGQSIPEDYTKYKNGGFIQWTPVNPELNLPYLHIAAKKIDSENPTMMQLEEILLHSKLTLMRGDVIVRGNVNVNADLYVDGNATLMGPDVVIDKKLEVKDTTKLKDLTVTGVTRIEDLRITGTSMEVPENSVGTKEVALNSLKAEDLAENSVGASEIAEGAVGTSEVLDNSLTANDLAANSVNASEIVAGAVRGSEVLDNSLTALDLAANSVTASEIAIGAVGSPEVLDNSLMARDLAANSVTASEIATGAVGSSEVLDNSLTTNDLAANSVTASEIAAGAVGSSEVINNSLTTADLAANSVGSSELKSNSVTSEKLSLSLSNYWLASSGGWKYLSIGQHTFCALAHTRLRDSGSICQVTVSNGTWTLGANSADCRARCF